MEDIFDFLTYSIIIIYIGLIILDAMLKSFTINPRDTEVEKIDEKVVKQNVKKTFDKLVCIIIISILFFVGWNFYDLENQKKVTNIENIADLEEDYNFDCGSNPNHKHCQ